MKQVTLNIDEGKMGVFMDLIKNLDYVSIAADEEHLNLLMEESNNRYEKVQSGEIKTRNWDEAKVDLSKK